MKIINLFILSVFIFMPCTQMSAEAKDLTLSNSMSTEEFNQNVLMRIGKAHVEGHQKKIITNPGQYKAFRAYWVYLHSYVIEEGLRQKNLSGSIMGIPKNMKKMLINAAKKIQLQFDIPKHQIPYPDKISVPVLRPPIDKAIENYINNGG